MHTHIHTYIHIYVYLFIFMHVCMYMCLGVYLHIYKYNVNIYVYVYIHTDIHRHIYIYIYIYIYICVCVSIYIYMYYRCMNLYIQININVYIYMHFVFKFCCSIHTVDDAYVCYPTQTQGHGAMGRPDDDNDNTFSATRHPHTTLEPERLTPARNIPRQKKGGRGGRNPDKELSHSPSVWTMSCMFLGTIPYD